MTFIRIPLVVLFVMLIAGCSSSGGDATRYYIIEPVAPRAGLIDKPLTIQITDLEVPQYLERFQIASRRTDHQLVFATSHQWAENLRKNLSRALAGNLSNLLGTADVGTPSSRSGNRPDFRLKLSIERFERGADGLVQLDVRWQLTDNTDTGKVTTRSSRLASDEPVSARDYAGTVNSMSELLAELSIEMTRVIQAQR